MREINKIENNELEVEEVEEVSQVKKNQDKLNTGLNDFDVIIKGIDNYINSIREESKDNISEKINEEDLSFDCLFEGKELEEDLFVDWELEIEEEFNEKLKKKEKGTVFSIAKSAKEEGVPKEYLTEEGKRVNSLLKEYPINYYTEQLPSFYINKDEKIKVIKNSLYMSKILQLVYSFFPNSKKKEYYTRQVILKEVQNDITDLIVEGRIEDLPLLVNKGYKLTPVQERLLTQMLMADLNQSNSVYRRVDYLSGNMALPRKLVHALFFNSTYQIMGGHEEKLKNTRTYIDNYLSKPENRHALLEDLIKSMNSINKMGYVSFDYSIMVPLYRLYDNHIKLFDDKNYKDFYKYLLDFKIFYNKVNKNSSPKYMNSLNNFLDMYLEKRNINKDDVLEDGLSKTLKKIHHLKSHENVEEVSSAKKEMIKENIITSTHSLSEELDKKILEIEKKYFFVTKNKEYLTEDKYQKISLLIKKHLKEMSSQYESFDGDKESMKNVEGKSLDELMQESIEHINKTLDQAIRLVNEEKISKISVKNRQIRSYKP